MSDPEIVRACARINAISGLLMNPSGVLVAADAYRLFVALVIDLTAGFWTLAPAGLIFSGLQVLSLLELESGHDDL